MATALLADYHIRLPLSHQLVVLSTLTYQPHYKGYPPSGHLASRLWHLTTSTNTRTNTHKWATH